MYTQDLQYLSEGLEGRSKNPVALLFDTLMQPNQDMGETHPSSLSWAHEPHRAISHVVLGRGAPGGVWHTMHPGVRSLSPWRWLQLPIYGFEDWLDDQEKKEEEEREGKEEEEEQEEEEEEDEVGRVRLGTVAKYYQHYIEKMGIADHFRSNVTVTQAHLLRPKSKSERRSRSCESTFSCVSSSESELERNADSVSPSLDQVFIPHHSTVSPQGEEEETPESAETEKTGGGEEEEECSDIETEVAVVCDSDDTGISCCTKRASVSSSDKWRWVVRGRFVDSDGQDVCHCVCAKNLVLATGVNDSSRRLGVPGENLGFVRHSLSQVSPEDLGTGGDRPVLVVGAGLGAADAVLHTLSQGQRVVHVFHQDSSDPRLVYNTMDPHTYSEYVTLYGKMCGRTHDPMYTPLSQHRVQELAEGSLCTLCNLRDGTTKTVEVSLALVLIGGQAKLDFLPECMSRQLGVRTDLPIDTKHNPMDLDPYTFESEQFPSLFALGPLSGDNFVRFVLGGALGITKKLREKDA